MKSLLMFALLLGQSGAAWTDLFDGKTMKGWTPVGTATWQVATGALAANPTAQPQVPAADGKMVPPSGFLQSDRPYSDFDQPKFTARKTPTAASSSGAPRDRPSRRPRVTR